MKFIITRTSTKYENEKPIPEAIEYTKIQDEFDEQIIYAIEINSIEELLELQEKYGELIILNSSFVDGMKEIEIYDIQRE